jgi:two-component system, LytTR family, sensor kinase
MKIKFGILIKPISGIKFILINLLLAIIIVLLFMLGSIDSFHQFLIALLWVFIICITQWSGIIFFNHLINRKIDWIERPVLRSVVGMASTICYSVIALMAIQFAMMFIVYGKAPDEAWQSVLQSMKITLMISLIMSLLFTAIGFFQAWRGEQVNAGKLRAEMMAYKYESLRNQINPHFLFNSFNVLSDLVYADQAMAVKFIHQMSDLFRYVLDSRDKELVTLAEEVEFIRSFAFLLKTRFEDKLDILVEVPATPDDYIVPMTLQLLVENAVKHNEISEAFPLSISIRKTGDYVEVENTLHVKPLEGNSNKTGLKNIEQQFGFFTDKLIVIDSSNGKFVVRVPILKAAEK